MNVIVLESCHSTWIFEPLQLRFCRILKGIEVGRRRVSTEWRPYRDLEIDPQREAFTVYLDEARTHLVRSSRHTQDCVECRGYETIELSLQDIHRAVASRIDSEAQGGGEREQTAVPAISVQVKTHFLKIDPVGVDNA